MSLLFLVVILICSLSLLGVGELIQGSSVVTASITVFASMFCCWLDDLSRLVLSVGLILGGDHCECSFICAGSAVEQGEGVVHRFGLCILL